MRKIRVFSGWPGTCSSASGVLGKAAPHGACPQVAQSCKISKGAVNNTLKRAREAGLTWPLSDDLDDAALEARLYTHSDSHQILRLAQAQPDWAWVSQEKKRRGVTLKLLWQEYHAQHPEGYRYTSYTTGYHAWKRDLDVTLRQDHTAGEKLFVDYAGMTLPITDPSNGALREAQIFVAVLGASNYTYCEATWTQSVKDWLGSPRRALESFAPPRRVRLLLAPRLTCV